MKSEIEQYSHIVNRLVLFWGYLEFREYIDQLILDERCNRKGFHPELMRELIFLKEIHETAYADKPKGPWDHFQR